MDLLTRVSLLFALLFWVSCSKPKSGINSETKKFLYAPQSTSPTDQDSVDDEDQTDEDNSGATADELFVEAYQIITNRCVTCHDEDNPHTDFQFLTTNDDWVNDGYYIDVFSPRDSYLLFSLQNEGGSMPLNDDALTDEEYQSIVNWIDKVAEEFNSFY